jgi:cell filamentation protein
VKPHPYCYPGTNVYRNKFDIRDAKELEDLERDLSAYRLLTLPHDAPITPAGYRAIHRYLFQDLYDWAGQYGRVTTGRGAAAFLPRLAADRFAARTIEHLEELNAIHPFLDGSGRTQRLSGDIGRASRS